jgi:hypothetical protein
MTTLHPRAEVDRVCFRAVQQAGLATVRFRRGLAEAKFLGARAA